MQTWSIATILVIALIAGCTEAPSEPQTLDYPSDMQIIGIVQDAALRPIAGAAVAIRQTGQNMTTGASGAFDFTVDEGAYLVDVHAAGYYNVTVPALPKENATHLYVTLAPIPVDLPFIETQRFRGFLQCAHEVLIISGSCDVLPAYVNDAVEPQLGLRPVPEPFEATNKFEFEVDAGWQSMVLDIEFSTPPGLDGLRVLLQGLEDQSQLLVYEQYGKWNSSTSFTIRIDPGQEYPEGDAPVPANRTAFRVEVLPHSHGYHQICDPSGDTCFLGAGAAIDWEFEVFVTAFYVTSAPEGFTLRDG